MEEVIHYLDLKNQYLEKFLSITQKFLLQIQEDRWEEMELFVDNRERVLNIIRSFDVRIAQIFERLDVPSLNLETYRARVKASFDRREEIAKKIVNLDLDLINKIEEIRTETIRELKRTVETAQQLNTFLPPAARRLKPTKDA